MSDNILSKYIPQKDLLQIISEYLTNKLDEKIKENIRYHNILIYYDNINNEYTSEVYESRIYVNNYIYYYTYTDRNNITMKYSEYRYILETFMEELINRDNIYQCLNHKTILKENNNIKIICRNSELKYRKCKKIRNKLKN